MNSFSDLLEVHATLDELFARHQHALLHFEFDEALTLLQEYEAELLIHMRDEEEVLLPIYEEKAEVKPAGAAKLFIDEHEKMRAHVRLFAETVERLRTETPKEPLLIILLEREGFYKRLSAHHDDRERNHLYPALDAAVTPEERQAILRGLESRPDHLTVVSEP